MALFLVAAPPSAGRADAPARDWALAFAAVGLVTAAAVTAARFTGGPSRAGWLALAAGSIFGLAGALTLSVTRLLARYGVARILGHWQLWALAALGCLGLVLSASMQRVGPLSVSLPIIDGVEPISAVLIGTLVFSERLAGSPAGLAVQLAGAAAAVAGIFLLGRSSLATHAHARGSNERGPRSGRGNSSAALRITRPPTAIGSWL